MAVYDKKTDDLKTFVFAGMDSPLTHYETTLASSKSLSDIIARGKPRVVNDIDVVYGDSTKHSQKIKGAGFASSYTMPIYHNGIFFGFVFFNSAVKDNFTPEVLLIIDIFGHLVSSVVTSEMVTSRVLIAALKSANDMVHYKDPETKAHLDRMARFARLIAKKLVDDGVYDFSDEYIENTFQYAPLHDVGKVAIEDKILLKSARLTEEEFESMKAHTFRGREIVEAMIANFGLDTLMNSDVLRNIAELHHKKMDGSGNPLGLSSEDIPPVARIVAVADVFDALTSFRPYKKAWTNKEAFDYLKGLSDSKFDTRCVKALVASSDEIEEIQKMFVDNDNGG